MYKKILVPIDGSEASRMAIESSLRLAETTHVLKVVLMTVEEIPPKLRGYEGDLGIAVQEMKALMIRDAEALLASEAEAFANSEIAVEKKIVWGDPPYEIVHEAREGNYDLVIIGSRGLGGVEKLLIGSVSMHVVQYAPCTVMVTKLREKQKAIPSKK